MKRSAFFGWCTKSIWVSVVKCARMSCSSKYCAAARWLLACVVPFFSGGSLAGVRLLSAILPRRQYVQCTFANKFTFGHNLYFIFRGMTSQRFEFIAHLTQRSLQDMLTKSHRLRKLSDSVIAIRSRLSATTGSSHGSQELSSSRATIIQPNGGPMNPRYHIEPSNAGSQISIT